MKYIKYFENLWEDFLENYLEYENEKEEADPFHWKHRNKQQEELMKKFGEDWD